jgi:hypothetical protein
MNFRLDSKRVAEFLNKLIRDIENKDYVVLEISMEKHVDPIPDEYGVIERKDNGMRTITIHYLDKHAS